MAGDSHATGDELIGRSLNGYVIESKLGSGATGVVFKAKHPEQDKAVALKVLHDNLGSITSLKRRFEREARVLAKLDHPNVVYITDFGVVDAYTFIAMELLEGQTLEKLLEDAPIEPSRAIDITHKILDGLAFAHDRKVVHRDLKPANVFLCRSDPEESIRGDKVKLLDFGLAKMLSIEDLSQDGTLTRKGRIVGTPAYMAPEQITGVSLDVRADVYALGILLYEMLADRRPFLSERRSELLRAHLLEPVPPLSGARRGLVVHPQLEALVLKALAKDPNNRFADAREMLQALEALPPSPARMESERKPPPESAPRKRTGATSEIISDSERRAVSESLTGAPPKTDSGKGEPARTLSASSSGPGQPPDEDEHKRNAAQIRQAIQSRPPPADTTGPNASATSTLTGDTWRPRDRRGPSTPALYATAIALLAIAAALWLTLGRG